MKMSLSFICREKSASMGGMSAILKILSGIVGMLLLSSCGVQIQLATLRPAAVDIGRGALITVHNLSGGRASAALTEAFCNHILTDGFYELSHRAGVFAWNYTMFIWTILHLLVTMRRDQVGRNIPPPAPLLA